MKLPSDHDLLTRIDERQQVIKSKLEGVEKCVAKSVNIDDEEYKEMRVKVDSLWDSKNKLVGWMLGAGIAGGGISTLLNNLVKAVGAQIK